MIRAGHGADPAGGRYQETEQALSDDVRTAEGSGKVFRRQEKWRARQDLNLQPSA